MQNVLIMMADGKGGSTDTISFGAHPELTDNAESHKTTHKIPVADLVAGERTFQKALLPDKAREVYAMLLQYASRADARLKFNIGYVAGNKKYFHPTQETISRFNLPKASLRPAVATSRQLSRQGIATSSMPTSTYLWLPDDELSEGERDYVAQGEQDGVDMAYKCRIRNPWYQVPGV